MDGMCSIEVFPEVPCGQCNRPARVGVCSVSNPRKPTIRQEYWVVHFACRNCADRWSRVLRSGVFLDEVERDASIQIPPTLSVQVRAVLGENGPSCVKCHRLVEAGGSVSLEYQDTEYPNKEWKARFFCASHGRGV